MELKEFLEKQELGERVFTHKHDVIYYDNLAKSISELKKSDEFKELDKLHCNDYKNINF